jgi:hypothetical protein
MTDEIAQRGTVAEMVQAYERAEAQILAACGQIAEALTMLGGAFPGDHFSFNCHRHLRFDDPDDAIGDFRRQAWRRFAERFELRRAMSIAKARELDDWIEKGTPEPISFESVMGLFRLHLQQLPEMLSEAVGEVYDFLRPARSQYKTNTEFELGRRVILTGWVERAWTGNGFRPSYYRQQHYVALDNVFGMLDGQGSTSKGYRSELELAIEKADCGVGETRFFRFRAHRNGNLHLEFKRSDLVERFNTVAGGRRLRRAAE